MLFTNLNMKNLVVCSVLALFILITVPSTHGYSSAGAILSGGKGKREFIQVSTIDSYGFLVYSFETFSFF